MLATDRDALVCDLAETYGILDYRALPVPLLATLSSGLRDTSRIKMRMGGMRATTDTLMLAAAVDKLTTLVWLQTKDAQHGRNRPKSLVGMLLGEPAAKRAVVGLVSAADFEAAKVRILREVKDCGD